MSKLLNEYIASRLPELSWRHFGVGALQAYLFEGCGYEQRVHIWHPSLVAPGIRGFGDMHNHRFSFTSKVLCGSVCNTEYVVESSADGYFDVYTVVNAREQKLLSGSFDGSVQKSHRANVIESSYGQHMSGDEYEFARGAFHVTRFDGVTVTLVTKFDVAPAGIRAEIVVPHGAELVHAFDESRLVDTPGILADALCALMDPDNE